MDDNDWELSKENIQPRKEGRDISSLMVGLTPRKETNLKLHNEKQQFELAIRSYDGPDPLDNWYRYIIWTEQHLLEGSDSDVRHLIERCIHLYKDDEKYKNDRKYLCIWLKYADSLKDPTEIFNYMHSQNIGTQHSLFYEDWATILESSGLLSQADEVYKLGIARKAQPVERLQRQHRAFEQRLVAFLRENVDSTDVPMTVESRMSLAPLKEKSKGTVSNDRVKGRSKSSHKILSNVQPVNQNKGAGFAIFNDENAPTTRLPTATGEWKKPPTNSTIVKENAPKPGQWNKSKVAIGAASKRQQGPVFNIYADEEPIHKPSDTPKQLIMSERMPLSSRKIDKKAGPEDVLQPIRQQADSNFEVMYCKELVYMGNQEFSLEELRGMEYIRKNGPINPSRNQCDFTTLAVTGMDLDETLMSSQKRFPKDGQTCVDDEDIEKTIMADGLAEETDKDISKRTEISKKLLFKNDKENQLESEAADRRQNVPRENHQESHRHRISYSPQPITSPSPASDLLNKTEFANSLDVSGLCPLESVDDFMPQHFQSTAIIDLKQMKQEMMQTKQNRQVFCDNEISKIQRIDNFEEDFQRIDISGGKQFGHEKMPGNQKKFEDVPFSRVATNFNHKEGSDKNETELASLSGVLDFPMMLSSKENAAAFSRQQQEQGISNYDQVNKRSILQKENSGVRVFADTKEDHVKVVTPQTMDYQDEARPTSQCLDFPMKLSSKVQPKPSTMQEEFDQIMGSEDDFMGNVMSNHEFSHYDIQMPTEVIKPKPVKAHFDILQSNEFDGKKNAAIQNNLKFAIFEDDDKENCQIDISEKDQPCPGAFVKIRNDVKRPTFADEKSSAFGQLVGEKFAAKSFMLKHTNNSTSENESVGFAQGRKEMPFSVFSDDQVPTAAEHCQLDAKKDRAMVGEKFPLSSVSSSRADSKEAFRSSLSSSDGAIGFKTPVSARKRMDPERGVPAFPLVPKSPIWAPSPTVHTKKAQQDILAMFNKTLDCERNDMTLNQTEEQTMRDTFEQQFNVTNGLNSDRGAAFKILDDDENRSSTSTIESHSLQDSNAYTTQAGNLEHYDVKELSPIEEFSEEERSRQSFLSSWLNNDKSTTISRSRLTSSESEDLQLGVMPYIAETTEDQRLRAMSYIAETAENEIFVPNEVFPCPHASDSTIRAKRPMSAGNASLANSVNSSARVQDAAVLFDINFIEKAASGLSFENYQNFFECSSEHLSEKFAVNSKVQIEQDVYKILKKVAVGGFSTVYSCISLNKNGGVSDLQKETALKVMKSESLCRWEFYISQQLHQRIEMQQLGSDLHESFILPNKAYTFRDGSVIAYPHYSAGTLLDFVNRCTQNNVKIQEKAAIAYTADICKIVKAMHDCNVIHGDIKPDNFLIRSDNIEDLTKINRLTIADFGRSIDLTMFPSDVTFMGSCNTDKFECTEMRKNFPWKYQVDYFAIACTIHVVVHGTYMEILTQPGGYRPSKTFRRVWNRNFWFSVFDRLLNVPDCGKQTILGEIIDECEKRLADV